MKWYHAEILGLLWVLWSQASDGWIELVKLSIGLIYLAIACYKHFKEKP